MTGKIKVSVIGVGNCCSALVQGVSYAKKYGDSQLGITHAKLGGYSAGDIEFVSAFDIDNRKVGLDLSEAIFSKPNTLGKVCEVPSLGVKVQMGPVLKSLNEHSSNLIELAESSEVDVATIMKDTGADVAVNFIPTGADEASRFYVNAALKAGCAFVNTTPAMVACDSALAKAFAEKGVPLVGDDVMSQIGGTVLHKNILEFLSDRGVKVSTTYQVDAGGGMETFHTLKPSVKKLKRDVKTGAVKSSLSYEAEVVAGTTDYVEFMKNSRTSYYWIKGSYFLETPVQVDITLRTMDAPNSSSIILDSLRAARIASERRIGGPITSLCVYGFKRPPTRGEKRESLDEAHRNFIEFVEGKRIR